MLILLVEDDPFLGDALCIGLKQAGHTVEWVTEGKAAISAALSSDFDVIILDIGLPRVSGLEVLKHLRGKQIQTPIVILTAADTVPNRIEGLDLGADDFLSKPFDLGELCARLRAVQRRSKARARATLTYKDIEVDPAARRVTEAGKEIILSRREFDLLQKLLENIDRVLSREQLTQTLYGWGEDVDSNALEVHVHNLRKKFKEPLVTTIRGVGYTIIDEKA